MAKNKVRLKLRLNAVQRKVLRYAGIFVVVIVFLQVSVYFASDILLRGYIKNKVEEGSDGKYTVDFDRFYLSLLERGFYVEGFELLPLDQDQIEERGLPFHRIQIPQFSIKGINYRSSDKTLVLGTIRFREPNVQSRIEDRDGLEGESPVRILEREIRKSIGDNLQEIFVRNLYIDNADLLLENFISQQAIKGEHTHFYIKNIYLFKLRETATPFNAEGFDFKMNNFELLLADSIHTVKAKNVHVSSLDNFIRGERVRLVADVTRPSDIYYQMDLNMLELSDADINKVFYTSEVDVGSLLLESPNFSVYSEVTPAQEGTVDYDLYPLIRDILVSISIADLDIEDGKYLQRSIKDANRGRIEAESINFKMDRVYIGPDRLKKQDQFFHAQDAALDLSNVRIALADGIHWVTAQRVHLSSFEDNIEITEVDIHPIFSPDEVSEITLFEIEIPSLSLNEANLKKIYNENIVDIREMVINEPSVLLRDVRAGENNKDLAQTSLQDLTRDFLKAIYVERLEMKEGNLVLDNHLRTRQDSLSFGKISFVLENFRLDESISEDQSSRIFLAEELQLDIQDYALKLSDNLHLFTADRIHVDTKRDDLQISNFRFRPADPDNIQATLDRYGRGAVIDIEIPEFYARGVDIPRAYFNAELVVNHIEVPSPVIKVNQYRRRQQTDEEEVKIDRGDIYDLLTSYFSMIKVDSLSLLSGTLEYENLGQDRLRTFAEDNVSIRVKNFYLDQNSRAEDLRTLFAEELDIGLDNYVFNLAEGRYTIVADRIRFNSAREEIFTSHVRLRPRTNLDAKVSISADIPIMSFTGVDLEAFIFDNVLELQKVRLSGTDVKLSINRDEDGAHVNSDRRDRERNLPKTLEIIKIDTVSAENSHINVAFREGGVSRNLIDSGINLTFFDFLLDSAKLAEGDIAAFFGNLAMEIDDFNLVLEDSIHTVKFSKVELNTQGDKLVFRDFVLAPINLIGNQGAPVISAHIPKVEVNTHSLREIQQTGEFIINSMALNSPDISIYLDQMEGKSSSQEASQEVMQNIISKLQIDKFEISNGAIELKEKITEKEIQSFSGISLSLRDLDFDLTDVGGINRKFFLNSKYEVVIPNYEIMLKDSLNLVRIGLATITGSGLILENVQMIPQYGKYQYTRKVGHQTDVISIDIPRIVLDGFNLDVFVEEKRLIAKSMHVTQPHAYLFRDKRFAKKEELHRPMPQLIMMNAGVDMLLDSLIITGGSIFYNEFPEKGMVPGNINFTDVNLTVAPFQLTKNSEDFKFESFDLAGNGFINHEAPLNLSGKMFFTGSYPINLDAEVGEFDLELINPILEANAFVSVRRGKVQNARWTIIADEERAIGKMILKYNNLNVGLLNERTLQKGTGRKRILTFVINAFAVRSNNPRRMFNTLIKSDIYLPRDKNKFIFNYWWQATLTGLQGAAGLGQPRIPKEEEVEITLE